MSELETRVGAVERRQAEQGVTLEGHGRELKEIKTDVHTVGADVKTLLTQQAARPAPVSWRDRAGVFVVTASAIGTLYVFVGWLVADITKDTTAKVERNTEFREKWTREGRLMFLEDRVRKLDNPADWPARITRNGGS